MAKVEPMKNTPRQRPVKQDSDKRNRPNRDRTSKRTS